MKAYYLLVAVVIFISGCSISTGDPKTQIVSKENIAVRVWPTLVAGQESEPTETVRPDEGDNITRLTDITIPTMTVYKAKTAKCPAPAVLVCPGGGFKILAINLEGTEIADWLNSIGVTAVVLKYRVPDNSEGAFADVQRAMSLIRFHAKDWNIDPKRLGVIGFSAGGNLCGRISTDFEKRSYDHIDRIDELSCRPDFAMLVYPYLFSKDDKLAENIVVTKKTPRTILIHTQDDWVKAENSILYYLALKEAKVPSELHVFPSGGHGYGLRTSKHAVSGWPKLCETWLKKMGIIGK